MKKLLSIVLCVCMLFLCGCDSTPAETSATSDTTLPCTETTAIDTSVPYQDPLVAVAVPTVEESTTAEDGTKIFVYTYQDISLTIPDPDVADAITADFLQRNDFAGSAQDVLNAAKASYTGQANWEFYFSTITYSPVRLDQQVLSFYGSEIIYNGTPRSVSANISVTYDLSTGKALSLEDILVANYSAEDLVNLILDGLAYYSQEGVLFADYEYIISDMFSTNTPVNSWYFSQKGLCFYFSPYEIAPNNAGTIVAEIPYESLSSLLKDCYFPDEYMAYSGTLVAEKAENSDMSSYTQFTEVVLDNQADEILLYPQGTTCDVRICVGSWNNGTFTAEYTIYAAAGLTTGDAVLLQVPDELIDSIAVIYSSDGAILTQPLNIS